MKNNLEKPNVVFIMSPRGTFTPFHSGALATNLRSCALEAKADGFKPLVVVRSTSNAPYEDVPALFVSYPEVEGKFKLFQARVERKLTGWPHPGQRAYTGRVARTLRDNQLQDVPWIISNDPDLAVFLHDKFPKAYIVHRFHNQMQASDGVKKKLAAAVNKCVAVSNFTRDWIEKYYGFQLGDVNTVYNGVDAALFTPADTPPSGPPVLNFVGRTGIEKGADILLDAALILAEEETPFGVQIVGANHWTGLQLDDYQRTLQERFEALEKKNVEVRRTGHVNRLDVPEQFRRAHIHVVPSRWNEPFGLTTVEGMASGLATVASKTGGSPEIIADAGFLFERDNPTDLADKLRPLLRDEALRIEYGSGLVNAPSIFRGEIPGVVSKRPPI